MIRPFSRVRFDADAPTASPASWIWQAPAIGAMLATVQFARLWRRVGMLNERLRDPRIAHFRPRRPLGPRLGRVFWFADVLAADHFLGDQDDGTISRETMGLPPEHLLWRTIFVLVVALVICALSGRWGRRPYRPRAVLLRNARNHSAWLPLRCVRSGASM